MLVHIFAIGATSSPCCASKALRQVADDNKSKFDQEVTRTLRSRRQSKIGLNNSKGNMVSGTVNQTIGRRWFSSHQVYQQQSRRVGLNTP
ncbi:Hypothetical predicted protein [Paramuricea clavata]|uniref:Uncharacterized protein n=1 Tax=Paramuricea clavata TaxID=317549 RepID=A0A7D9DLZ8_PARCT|nr:Hypothetical predicted protein [Paramuricea clavata]